MRSNQLSYIAKKGATSTEVSATKVAPSLTYPSGLGNGALERRGRTFALELLDFVQHLVGGLE